MKEIIVRTKKKKNERINQNDQLFSATKTANILIYEKNSIGQSSLLNKGCFQIYQIAIYVLLSPLMTNLR